MARKEGYMISRPSRRSSSDVFIDTTYYSEIKNWHFGALSFSLSPIYPKSTKLPSKSLGSYRSLLSGGLRFSLLEIASKAGYYQKKNKLVTYFLGRICQVTYRTGKNPESRAGSWHQWTCFVEHEKWRASNYGKTLVGWVKYCTYSQHQC